MSPRPKRFRPQDFTLLIASGDGLIRQSLAGNLEAAGYHISSMRSSEQVMRALTTESFDLFILDTILEPGNGEDLLRELKEKQQLADTPSIMLVEKGDQLAGEQALKMGASSFLRKPVNITDVAEEATQLLTKASKATAQTSMKVAKPTKSTYAVLIVEDDVMSRELLVRRLKREGYATTEARNGREALEKLKERKFDLVLLDIMMPEVDGYEVLSKIKMYEESKEIPVIMLTALNNVESVRQCMHIGVDDYITKPFNFAHLREKIRACLGIIR